MYLFQRVRWLSVLMVTPVAGTLYAQDACIALLQHGIYDTHAAQASTQTFASFRSNFCGWYSSYRQTHQSAAAGVTIPIADIPIGFSGSMTYGEADAMQYGLCSATASTSSLDQTWSQLDRTLNPAGTQAFTQCVTALRGGLAIDLRVNDDESQLSIGLAYNPPLGAGPGTLNMIKNDGWICAAPTAPQTDLHSIAGKTGRLTNSQVGMSCNRDIKPTPFIVGGQKVVADRADLTLQTTAGLFTVFFRPRLFEDPIADTAKVLASYPKGTILPFAGQRNAIPAGWHICDGTSGTVNLIDRVPYGASTDAQIGRDNEGQATHSHAYDAKQTEEADIGGAFQPPRAFQTLGNERADHTHRVPAGNTNPASSLPPVTRIFFIQKIN